MRPSTESDTVTAPAEAAPADDSGEVPAFRGRRRLISPLTLRILAVNVLALAILAAGLLYMGQYKRGLVAAELSQLHAQGRLLALALGEGAVTGDEAQGMRLAPEAASRLVRRLAQPTGARVRLFALDGSLIADSRRLLGPGGLVEIEELEPLGSRSALRRAIESAYDFVADLLPGLPAQQLYTEAAIQRAEHYSEVERALSGRKGSAVRATRDRSLLLSVAEPVQHYKQVVGALLLSRKGVEIDAAMRSVRLNILAMFAVALAVTVLLSIYLAGTIAQPVRRLAAAAERVRRGQGRKTAIPDLAARRDEIGDLSAALREMTAALWQRMDAIERFAADVAHEIKNPLTSLRSAVETAVRLQDPEQQRRLMAIIFDDVRRLDRLISDISDASRLDAELSRAEVGPVDVGRMLETLADIHRTTAVGNRRAPALRLEIAGSGLRVRGMEGRLVQVFRNLLSNAVSFSPEGGRIAIRAARSGDAVLVAIEDEGPGIPAGKEEAIFERFYSERPEGEKFGTHSGLGLSISRQIVEAHHGRIWAENRRSPDGAILGARFLVRLPAA